MLEISSYFISYDKTKYPNLKSINFTSSNEIKEYLNKYITETKKEPNAFFGGSQSETEGVYIYQSNYDKNTGFRLYKDWSNNIFSDLEQHPSDAKMLSILNNRQKNIKLTDFPTGIITLKGFVIGQIIPLYNNSYTLEENLDKLKKNELFKYYKNILEILKELQNNEIIYADIHTRNFIVYNNIIKLIDFDPYYVSFDNLLYSRMINNLKIMINKINQYKDVKVFLAKEETLDNIEETIMTKMLKKL